MDIYRLLSKGLGLGEYFDYTDEEFIQMLINTDLARATGLTWERLEKEKVIQTLPSCWVNWKDNKFDAIRPSGVLFRRPSTAD